MSLDSLSLALTQIQCLVTNLSKKNYNSSGASLRQLLAGQGLEARRQLLRSILAVVDFGSSEGTPASNSKKEKDREQQQLYQQLLVEIFAPVVTRPDFVTTLLPILDSPLRQSRLKLGPQLFTHLSRLLRLNRTQEVVFRLSLLNAGLEVEGFVLPALKQKLLELIKLYINQESRVGSIEGGLQEASPEVIHFILRSVKTHQTRLGIGKDLLDSLLLNLCKDYPPELVPVILAPFLYPQQSVEATASKMAHETGSIQKNLGEGSLADLIRETGYSFTASVEECRTHFASFGLRELPPASIARAVHLMARTHSKIDDGTGFRTGGWSDAEKTGDKGEDGQLMTWNIDVFVQVVQELSPSLNWNEVIAELDFPGFGIKDSGGLRLLLATLQRGLQSQTPRQDHFPVEYFYRNWKNAEGQASLLSQLLKNPEVFCFADFPHHPVNVEILKSQPELDSKELANWRCLEVIDTLLHLREYAILHSQVQELLKFPIHRCPDVLVLGLLQLSSQMTGSKQELLSSLIPIFLGNHPNSATILHHVWNAQLPAVKPLVMHAMAEWYLRKEQDQSCLSRILDVAQDLKALSLLLNLQSFPFVIDLACLASRREYLKLDKWLTDKMREHGEPFVLACVKFLQRKCPQILGNVKEDAMKPSQLPPDTLTIIVTCLQACIGNVSQELADTIMTMVSNCSFLTRVRQPPPGVLKPHRPGMDQTGMDVSFPPGAFTQPAVDQLSLSRLNSGMAGLGLGSIGGANMTSSSGFGLAIGPNPLVGSAGAPGSPGKLFSGGMGLGDAGQLNPGSLGLHSGSSAGPSPSPYGMLSTLAGASGALPGNGVGNPLNLGGLGLGGGLSGLGPTSVSSSAGVAGSSLGIQLNRLGMAPQAGTGERPRDVSIAFPESTGTVSKEIEDETNSYFQRIYNQSPHAATLTVDEVLELLKKFQHSPNKREVEIFNCMLRNLFEEYRFFPQYPDRELNITAQLFGGIMEHGLVTYMSLGLALRFVLDAVRKPHGSKMYLFGITALDRFRHRLKEYQQYCQHLAAIPHFSEFPPHLIEYIEYGARGQEPPSRPHGPVLSQASTTKTATPTTTISATSATPKATPAATISGRPSIANATNIDTLLVASEKDEKIREPPENVQDKISFICNNLSQLNLQQKCEEMKEILSEEHWPWLAQYLVMKRASIEPNFHTLYSNFLDTLKLQELNKLVVRETFRNIKVLLRSDKGIANFSDRSLLKNLGHWLGLLTLAKNKPILQVDVDLKSLLIEAYHKGQQELLYVVPFVAKILESCAKSKIFRLPNPWTLGIMNVLAELHQEPEVKLNLKFEIEVLCKTLNIDVHDLKPGMAFKDVNRLARLEPQLSQNPASFHQQQQQQQQHLQQQQQQQQQLSTPPVHAQPPQVGTTTPTPTALGPPEPRFSYLDINIGSLAALAPHLVLNSQVAILQANPQLKSFVRPAVERAVQDWIVPVVERSIKIALTTCEQIIKKDFALDPDEARMRTAAHHMVRNLTAGMALITCRDHLLVTIANNLKGAFMQALRGSSAQHKEMIEQISTLIAGDNVEVACVFIQKTAVEKAIIEIDKRLAGEYELRKHARNEGRRYCDPHVLAYQAERMPEAVRLKVGGVTAQQAAVYEEFALHIPGFLPISERDASHLLPKPIPAAANDEASVIFERVAIELERYYQTLIPLGTPQALSIGSLLESVMIFRNSRDPNSALVLLQKAFEGLVEGLVTLSGSADPETLRFRDAHLIVLKALQDPQAYGVHWVKRNITRCLIECREEYRYNIDVFDCLLRHHLISVSDFDVHLAATLEASLNPTGAVGGSLMAPTFAMQLIHIYLIDGPAAGVPALINEGELCNTIEMLARIATHARTPPENLPALLEMLRSSHEHSLMDRTPGGPGGPTALIHSGIAQARDYDDPAGLREKTQYLLQEWIDMYHLSTAGRDSSKAFAHFVTQMSQNGILKTDDLITRFFRLCTQICVDLTHRALSSDFSPGTARAKAFHSLDAYVRLIALLIKHSGDASSAVTKVNLLNKVLGIIAGVLLQSQELRRTEFHQLPYHRILIMLFLELNAPEPVLEAINFQVLTAFCQTLYILRPAKAPGFAYAWLEIVSHRVFMGRLLAITPQQKGWGMYAQLLIALFKFLAPFLRNAELSKPVSTLYKGTLRVLLVLLHDFPEFLCDYHYGFCDNIPPNCIQMRNLILSAFPRNMRLPDPFTPNLKVDLLPEINHAPRVLTHFAAMIQPPTLKKDLDSYLKTRGPVTFLSELRSVVQVSPEPGMRYNLPLLNALVLYVGTQAIQAIQAKGLSPSMATIGHSSFMDIFQSLAVNLDTEGRYLFINAIANQLRYPNSHTHYFSCVLLCLFNEANSEAIQEQITRVLLERLIVNRPHPWGLLITFIELIKNPVFKFWNHDFVHCAPEIEKLFGSVARACMVQNQPPRDGESRE